MGERERLDREYRQTVFWVELPDDYVPLRIGTPEPRLAAHLTERRCEGWALLSAWNPHSKLLPPPANRERQSRFAAGLERRGLRVLRVIGVGDQPDWPPEESLLVLGVTREEAVQLGRDTAQNAIVVGDARAVPELLWCTAPTESPSGE